MSNDLRESLSALMDGEASELELRRILRHGDASTDAFWGRLHQQRGAMLNEPAANWDISARVSLAIAAEEPLKRAVSFDWRKPLGGLAVAASVAALVVFGVGGAPTDTATPVLAESVAPESSRVYLASPGQSANGAVTASVSNTSVPRYHHVSDEHSKQRFERFLQQHTERAALNNGQGMVTYARLVSHEAE